MADGRIIVVTFKDFKFTLMSFGVGRVHGDKDEASDAFVINSMTSII